MSDEVSVNKEKASERTAVTVRWMLAGAGFLMIVFSIGAACMLTAEAKDNSAVLQWYIASTATLVGIVVIGGTLAKMNRGIRQQNLKAIGITLIAVLVVVLALYRESAVEAAIGLLSAMAGYLFGKDSSSDDEDTKTQTTG